MRRVAFIVTLALTALFTLAWPVSVFSSVGYFGKRYGIMLGFGSVCVTWGESLVPGGRASTAMPARLGWPFWHEQSNRIVAGVPLWMLAVATGILAALLWRRGTTNRYRRQRLPTWVAGTLAVLCFCVMLFVVCLAEMLAMDRAWPLFDRLPDFAVVIGVTVNVFCVYLLSRHVYRKLRWRLVLCDGTACKSCGYNLTGNVSGRCPECGKGV